MNRDELIAWMDSLTPEEHAEGFRAARERVAARRERARAAAARMREGCNVILVFTIPKGLWLTSNRQTNNRGYKQRIVGDLQLLAATVAQQARIVGIGGKVAAHWTIRYPKGVRVDKGEASNAQPTTKALLDGLVNVGLIEDDGPAWIVSETFTRGPNLDRPSDHEIRLVLTPQEVPW